MELIIKEINNDFDESLMDFLSDLDKDEFDITIFKLIFMEKYSYVVISTLKIQSLNNNFTK